MEVEFESPEQLKAFQRMQASHPEAVGRLLDQGWQLQARMAALDAESEFIIQSAENLSGSRPKSASDAMDGAMGAMRQLAQGESEQRIRAEEAEARVKELESGVVLRRYEMAAIEYREELNVARLDLGRLEAAWQDSYGNATMLHLAMLGILGEPDQSGEDNDAGEQSPDEAMGSL